jgi:hypothetical protein
MWRLAVWQVRTNVSEKYIFLSSVQTGVLTVVGAAAMLHFPEETITSDFRLEG